MKKILYSIEISRYRDTEKRNHMNDIALPRLSLKSVHHPRPRFLSYSVMPILLSLLAGLFILTACENEIAAPKKDSPPSITSIFPDTVSVAIGKTTNVTVSASDPDPGDTPSFSLVNNNLDFIRLVDLRNGTATINIAPLDPNTSMHVGRHRITVKATSGSLFAEVSFTLNITDDDSDSDGTVDRLDVDDDNDGLIEINSLEDLHNIRYNLAGTSYKTNDTNPGSMNGAPASGLKGYELVRNLDFKDPTSYSSGMVNTAWTTGSGWPPIGDNSTLDDRTQFTGILEGNGHKITNLMIRRDTLYVGLFGYIGRSGQVRNLGLENAVADYTGNSDLNNYIGLLAGQSEGTNIAVHTSGIANGGDGTGDLVGGLVGDNSGTITACHATGNANGGDGDLDRVGGLVGQSSSTITDCYATGNANGGDGDFDFVGGLVGFISDGTITASYATGMADGGSGIQDAVGGLVGQSSSTITASYATGMADGGSGIQDAVGGLVGVNEGTITNCYATSNANGGSGTGDRVGGLVGHNLINGTITACHATGNANGGDGDLDRVGGLVGQSSSTITACYATGMADGGDGDTDSVGGLVGWNTDTITACHATGNANGGDGDLDSVGGLVGQSSSTITACYATGMADGGEGERDVVGVLVGWNDGTITACYATGMADGGEGDSDRVGGLVGWNNNSGTIAACYATGNANGGDGLFDQVGGLVGVNRSTITDCYATGNANGGEGANDEVGRLVGENPIGTITASYGFGTKTGEIAGVDRSDDATTNIVVGSASALTMTNSATTEANRWPARVWDFGTDSQVPVLKWITSYDNSGTTEAERYPCDEALLPAGRRCGEIIPGQGR